ncbi:MAG: family 10 glycosylhydrolase [Chthonomonas sp.]|nr:family 10 glycosylhydrolase [Chthonomonas sp.]
MMVSQTPEPTIPREFRGVWVATVDNIDWPTKRGLSTADQKAELLKIVETAYNLRLNAIVFQVRPSADAMYKSALEPWSIYLNGADGKAPNPAWDPLEFIIAECHKRGMELHAWFNPYRAWHPAAKADPSAGHIAKMHPEVVRDYGTFMWMDPSEPFVQQRSYDVMIDVVKRYDVDGIHIDDYFYPYPVRDADKKLVDFPDAKNFDAYQSSGGKLNKGDWRRKQVDDFIQRLYTGIHKTKRHVQFGISPFGIYRPGVPEGTSAGIDQYDALYADCLKWLQNGWMDYMTPQLYWPIGQKLQSYPVLLKWWLENNTKGRHLIPGNYTGQIGSDASWPVSEIENQIDLTRKAGAEGNIHFSMKVFTRNAKGVNDALRSGKYADRALPPASPWLSGGAVPAPVGVNGRVNADGSITIKYGTPRIAGLKSLVLVETKDGRDRILGVVPASSPELTVQRLGSPKVDVQSLRVALTDRANVLGPWVRVSWKD